MSSSLSTEKDVLLIIVSAHLANAVHHTVVYPLIKLRRTKGAPSHFLELSPQDEIVIDIGLAKLFHHMLSKVQQRNPTVGIGDFVEPLFVVAVIARVEIQYVFANEDEPLDPFRHEGFNDVALEGHDIVEERVVPFSDEFEDGEPFIVVREKDFHKERTAPHVVPLRVNKVVVYPLCVVCFAVDPLVKRGPFVFTCDVKVSPVVEGFEVVH